MCRTCVSVSVARRSTEPLAVRRCHSQLSLACSSETFGDACHTSARIASRQREAGPSSVHSLRAKRAPRTISTHESAGLRARLFISQQTQFHFSSCHLRSLPSAVTPSFWRCKKTHNLSPLKRMSGLMKILIPVYRRRNRAPRSAGSQSDRVKEC